MTRRETFGKCVLWYLGASALAPLSCLAIGAWEIAIGLVVHLPAIWLLCPALFASFYVLPRPVALPASELSSYHTPVVVIAFWTIAYVIGYLVPIGVLLAASLSHNENTRRRCYLGFVSLLVADVGLALVSPFLYLIIIGAGE